MKIQQRDLIKELRAMTAAAQEDLAFFKQEPEELLNAKTDVGSWSVLENMEHLCRYGAFYLPEIEKQMDASQSPGRTYFKSGLLGDYFVKIIRADNKKKLKATAEMDVSGSALGKSTLNRLSRQLEWLDRLLQESEQVNLNRVKTAISLSSLVKLRLGDTLRFLVHHNERHFVQAKEGLRDLK